MKIKFDNTNYKSKKTVIFLSVIVIVAAIIFISFSYFTPNITEENNYTTSGSATGGNPSITYTDVTSGINLTGTYPMLDEEGLTLDPYTFNIRNNESESIVYEIYLQTETGNTVPDNLVNFSLDSSPPSTLSTKPEDTPSSGYAHSYKIKTGELAAGANRDFNLQVWFNESGTISTVQNKNWYGKIFVKARFGIAYGSSMIKKLVEGAPTNTTDVITKPAPNGATCTNTLAYDNTVDNNLRYVGADPCNYVTFNGETAGWRIIGVMNNIDDGTGKLETRIKLVRATSLENYSWDTSASGVNSGYGINDWTQADLKNELNGDYLDTTLTENTNWYNGRNNVQTGTFDITKRLGLAAQGLIGNTKWNLGGMQYTNADLIPSTMYTLERGNKVWGSTSGQTCNDGYCPRSLNWTGKVALIYPSDYGYATAGGSTTSRNTCINSLSTYNNSSGESWTNNSYSNCKNNDYLNPSSGYNWLLSPYSYYALHAFAVSNAGVIDGNVTYNTYGVLPAVYLKSDVLITGGTGTSTDPYTLG